MWKRLESSLDLNDSRAQSGCSFLLHAVDCQTRSHLSICQRHQQFHLCLNQSSFSLAINSLDLKDIGNAQCWKRGQGTTSQGPREEAICCDQS